MNIYKIVEGVIQLPIPNLTGNPNPRCYVDSICYCVEVVDDENYHDYHVFEFKDRKKAMELLEILEKLQARKI